MIEKHQKDLGEIMQDIEQSIQMIDLKKIDFDRPGVRQIVLDKTFSPVDITSTAADLAIK